MEEVAEKVTLYLGLTHKGGNDTQPMEVIKNLKKKENLKNSRFRIFIGSKIFFNPLLGTSEVG